MRGNVFIFDSDQLMHDKCHIANFKRGASYIDSPDQIKKKKTTRNPKITDDNCFQIVENAALNYREVKCNPERLSNTKPFKNKHNV